VFNDFSRRSKVDPVADGNGRGRIEAPPFLFSALADEFLALAGGTLV
jgi:hypothetical protein